MQNMSNNCIEKLGFDKWFKDRVDSGSLKEFDLARVIAVHKDSYMINNGMDDVLSELVGKIIYGATSPEDYPAVGDWVFADFYNDNTFHSCQCQCDHNA